MLEPHRQILNMLIRAEAALAVMEKYADSCRDSSTIIRCEYVDVVERIVVSTVSCSYHYGLCCY